MWIRSLVGLCFGVRTYIDCFLVRGTELPARPDKMNKPAFCLVCGL